MRALALTVSALSIVLASAPMQAQEPERAPPAGMVGVLRLPGLFGADACDPAPAQPIPLYAQPGAKTPFATLELIRPATPDPQGGCASGRVVGARLQGGAAGPGLASIEIAYEQPAAIALAMVPTPSGPWCQLLLRPGQAWVHEGCESGFISLEALLADQPLYLLEGAIEQARGQPGRTGRSSLQRLERGHTPRPGSARLLGRRIVDGQTWLHLAASEVNTCERSPLPHEEFELWLPLRNAVGRPNVWFHARGC